MKKWWDSPVAALGALCGEKAQEEAEEQLRLAMKGAAQAEYQRGYEDVRAAGAPTKTADEMFRELGYEPIKEDSNYPLYQDKKGIAIEIAVPAKSIAKWARCPWKPGCFPFNAEEILACAQLIKEMEDKHETD